MTKPLLYLIAGAAGAALLLAVLYWMTGKPVHALPGTLSPLTLTEPGAPVPSFVVTGADGKLHSLREFRGKLVLLNLWAPWCAPCVKELPQLAALQQALPPGKFAVLAVDVGRETPGEAAAFLKAHGAGTLAAYSDSNNALLRGFGAYGLPVSLLIDGEGKEIGRALSPPDWSAPDSVAYLKWQAER